MTLEKHNEFLANFRTQRIEHDQKIADAKAKLDVMLAELKAFDMNQDIARPTKLGAGDFYFEGSMKAIELRKVKEGGYFKRKPSAYTEYIRNHYNRKDVFGPANYSCSDAHDMNREIFLKPSTIVYIET